MIAIMDYGVGNLRSVQKAFEKVGYTAVITSSPDEILSAPGVVLPGVGAFGDAMDCLKATGLDAVVKKVAADGKPLLGVCLGLQLLFTESEERFGDESGSTLGLGIVPGRVVRFREAPGLKVPQIGWNTAMKTDNSQLFQGVPDGSYFYFVHSYHAVPEDESVVSTWTEYGVRFPSSIAVGRTYAAQFHPEKSSKHGLALYANFGRVVEECS